MCVCVCALIIVLLSSAFSTSSSPSFSSSSAAWACSLIARNGKLIKIEVGQEKNRLETVAGGEARAGYGAGEGQGMCRSGLEQGQIRGGAGRRHDSVV